MCIELKLVLYCPVDQICIITNPSTKSFETYSNDLSMKMEISQALWQLNNLLEFQMTGIEMICGFRMRLSKVSQDR